MYWFPFLHKNGIYVVVLLLLLFVCILSSQTDNYVHSMLALTPVFYDFFAIKSQICAALTESSQATNIGPGSTSLAWASRISLLPDILLTNASINWSLDELVWQSCGPTSARFDVTLNFTFLMTHQLSLGDLESQEDDMFSQSVLMDLNKYSTSTPSSSSTFSSHSLPLADDPNLFDRMMQTHPLFVRVGQLLFSPASGKAPLHSFSSYSVPIVTDVYSGNDQEITQTAILTSECRQFPDEFDWSDDGTTLYTHIAIELQECWSSFCNPSSSRPAFLLRLSFPLHSNQTVADLIRDSAPPSDTHDQWLDRLPIALKHESERFSATTKQEQEIIQKEPLYTELIQLASRSLALKVLSFSLFISCASVVNALAIVNATSLRTISGRTSSSG